MLGTRDAGSDLLDIDAEFMLFVHAMTDEPVVRDGGRIGAAPPARQRARGRERVRHPEGKQLSGPLEFGAARREMDFLDHRFLYFMDGADGRGKVIYLRHDGDYGLVEPA